MKEYNGYNYEKVGETYTIYTKEGKPWIVEIKSEEAVKQQIDDIVASQENAGKEAVTLENLQEQITELQEALAELAEGGNA